MTDIHRHDLSDELWLQLKPYLPGSKGNRGRRGNDNRLFLNAVLWKLRTGVPWRDIPPQYGKWNSVYKRFGRWEEQGVWADMHAHFAQDPDMESVILDSTVIRAHPCAAGGSKKTDHRRSKH